MKILLDECITKRLKFHLSDHAVYTVTDMLWNGIKNGRLMTLCVENNFDVMLTIDKNIAFQQNLDQYQLTIVVLNTVSSKIEELILFIPSLKLQLPKLEKSKAYFIDK